MDRIKCEGLFKSKMKQSERITEIHTDVKWIKKTLSGNGGKGLIEQVTSNTKWRNLTTGGLIVLSALMGWGIIKLI